MVDFGANIRRIRKARGLSLKDLSEASGLTVSYLSKTELNKVNPSINTLFKIARALGVTVSAITADSSDVHLVRSDNRTVRINPGSDLRYEMLAEGQKMIVMICSLGPGDTSGEEHFAHGGEACVYVVEGSVVVFVGGQEYPLTQGDALSFRCSLPHRFWNASEHSQATVVWCVSVD